ncbi:transglycosylase SLT domain-containing protein [Amycolatopsis sp. NPDC059027]|uniref:transglycosylase SLT domain-containing protein n=1 Tax=unclassified Amycolatopsis TaxID=2618356 RepID=UPI00367067AC
MSTLTATQIAEHAYKAGFRGHALETAVAVAMAESGGNPHAHNGTPPDNSYGLWQINMLGSMGPARRHQFHLHSNSELFDPDENAKAAYAIAGHGKNFGPWSTYTNGAYKKHLAAARKAAAEVSKHHGKPPHHPKKPVHHPPKGKGHGGFKTDPEQLIAYSKKADHIAAELKSVGSRTVHAVTSIAKDSFGHVGVETGFSGALGQFSKSLEKQVAATGRNAQVLGSETSHAAKSYRANDNELAADITGVLG